MELEKLSFPEAFRLLAERAGMQVEETAGSEGSERQSYLELYRRLADSFRHILVRTAAARAGPGAPGQPRIFRPSRSIATG